jgi:phage shock protein PspC (stress-responsive transcriptional regulator)
MKKTINININGISFILDEDAFQLLDSYLKSIKVHFRNRSGSDEIISDIEARIAELFQQILSDTKQVLNIDDVRSVQDRLGQTSDFNTGSEEETVYEARPPGARKRLYRDVSDRMIGGVCSGLGAYFHIDTTWVRLAFVIALVSGVSPLAYIILWIVMPAALTESERNEMYGGTVNISNIEKSIREELNEIRDKVDDLAGQAREKFKRKK